MLNLFKKQIPKTVNTIQFTFSSQIKKTHLNSIHREIGGKMVEFAGWDMPVKYDNLSIVESHLHTRNKCSLFDVGHMGQYRITGPDRKRFFETVVVADVHSVKLNQSKLSCFTNENGGIKDDCMFNNREDDALFLVVNAACKEKDHNHKYNNEKFKDKEYKMLIINFYQINFCRPKTMEIVEKMAKTSLRNMPFMTGRELKFDNIKVWATRCGYTGEDGFELSIEDPEQAKQLTYRFLANPLVEAAGLGARDSLRLESGLCLYGNDMDETTTPSEASLLWLISKNRKQTGGFLGDSKILSQIKNKSLVKKKRIGLLIPQGPPARQHALVFDPSGNKIGEVTSGTFSPVLKKGIAMAYVPPAFSKNGTKLQVEVRGRLFPAIVTKMPFVPAGYYKVPGDGKSKK
ncbi:aminomethyltransferase [Anaeramoeba ignava]|uniref:Aminomethyltransferase n=1 Tax=Anaeramoeba ignava TaxID=1746090 RepID=A0A9Q0LBC1_ANAIG|nr:aminomethyltransferase [Anaeramoeba ignava]